MNKICSFIGHKDLFITDTLFKNIRNTIIDLIENENIKDFYCGGYGNFDNTIASLLKELKSTYGIRSYLVIAYINPLVEKKLKYIERCNIYDEIIYPEIENIPLKFAIKKRNEWIVDHSDIIVVYVDHSWGGAYQTYKYAKHKNKLIINIAQNSK